MYYITLSHPASLSPSPSPSLSPSLSHPPSLNPSLLPSLPLPPLPFTDGSATQTTAVHENNTDKNKSLLWDQGGSEKAEVKRKVLKEVLSCERELLCRMWGGRLFPTRGAWTENDLWPKPMSFHLAQEKFFSSELERRVRDGVYTERQYDRYGGRVPSKEGKAKVTILKSILSFTGSQWIFFRSGVTCPCLLCEKQLWLHNFDFL